MTGRATLLDIARQTDPDGTPALVFEVLNEVNPMLQDAPAFPSNNQLGERVTLRSTLPSVAFTQLNKGTARSKGGTRQVVDTIGFLTALSEVDDRMPGIIGEAAVNAYRHNEDMAFMEAMSQTVATALLYGNEITSPTQFTGLAPRLASLSTSIYGSQVASQGSVAGDPLDGTSIYIVDWGQRGAHLIYPKDGAPGSAAGLQVKDRGSIRVTDAAGNAFMALVTEFTWLIGLTVKDPRRIARLANIDTSDVQLAAPTQGTLWRSLLHLLSRMPPRDGMNRVMYTTRAVQASFWAQVADKSTVELSIREYLGEPVVHFMGIPIRAMDKITASEGAVS